MKKINNILWIAILLYAFDVQSQIITLRGEVEASSEIEGIHVLNLSAEVYTVTDSKGKFTIKVSENDSVLISSVQYVPKTIIISKTHIETKTITIALEDRVNELDEVVVGKVLTGDLNADIKNSDAKRDINFYDVGIPGYTGKPKTLKEKRLLEADGGKFVYYYGLIATINIHKILNRISGRTKKLQQLVRLEQQDECMKKAMSDLSDELFGHIELDEALKVDFFYYASEDSMFLEVCQQNSELKMYEFLVQKLLSYSDDIEAEED
ncbi:carboxypeptidase-like regulatory domain-containing protein [Psychroserpens sp. XS_ASV72]|uniref:carboxypeptidase-like regulatory domain-containing protein n=1 Tax=Psychroserpens sp. XS_ASV72 TaxID=3241293 RepID=UPI00351645CA